MKFSIVCLTYKRPHLLEEAIYSVLNQSFSDWELIIVNDCPEQKLHYVHPQVILFNLDKKFESLGQKRNFAIEVCEGEFILNMDDDDLLLPSYLETLQKTIGNNDWLCAQKPILYFDSTEKALLSPVPQYSMFVFKRSVTEKIKYQAFNYDEITPFYRDITKFPSVRGIYRQLKSGEHGYVYRQDITPDRKYKMSQLQDGNLKDQNNLLFNVEFERGDIYLNPQWDKDYTSIIKNTLTFGTVPESIKKFNENLIERSKKENEMWTKAKPTWLNAKKFLDAAKSRGILSTALDVIGINDSSGNRVSEEVYQLRKTSCFGDPSRYIAPCSRLKDLGKKGFYCGGCGCGDNDLARLDSETEDGYTKLHYPLLDCPLQKEGFSNYSEQLPPMSIIIPVLNDQEELTNTIKSIRETSPSNVEIIVIDDSSDTPVKVDPSVKLIRTQTRLGVGATRWIGAQNATKDYLLFIDSHMRFDPNWYKSAITHLKDNPSNIVWCATCLGLEEGNMDIFNPKGEYNGARLSLYDPENGEVFEGKWISNKEGDEYELSCMMGACYFFHKSWFFHIKGTSSLKMWGSDEPLLSLKTWLAGGSLKLMKSVRIGHKFRFSSPYRTGVEYLVYNKLRSMYMLLPEELYKFLSDKIPNDGNKQKALQMLQQDKVEIEEEKNYYKNIFTKDIKWFCEKFEINI